VIAAEISTSAERGDHPRAVYIDRVFPESAIEVQKERLQHNVLKNILDKASFVYFMYAILIRRLLRI